MFISDDEVEELNIKDDTVNIKIKEDNIDMVSKKPTCFFFIPKPVSKEHNIKDKINENFHQDVEGDIYSSRSDLDVMEKLSGETSTDESKHITTSSLDNSLIMNGEPIITKNVQKCLSLISNPNPNSMISIEGNKKEKQTLTSIIPSSSISESFSSLPPLQDSSVTKSNSDRYFDEDSDQSCLIKQSPPESAGTSLKITDNVIIYSNKRNLPKHCSINLNESKQIISSSCEAIISSTSCSVFVSNSSGLKMNAEVSSSKNIDVAYGEFPRYRSWQPSSCSSPQTSVHSLRVDVDREKLSNECQPTTAIDRIRSERILKRKFNDQASARSSFCNIKIPRKSAVSRSDTFNEVQRAIRKVIETDETAHQGSNYEKSMTSDSEESVRSASPSPKISNSKLSMENNLIFCFTCKTDSKRFCVKHPMETVFNVNIDCPYIEYLTDDSYDEYVDPSVDVLCCCCHQNELEHIQQSLPSRFQLRESELYDVGIWTKAIIAQGSIIGPYLGEIIERRNPEQLTANRYKTRGASRTDMFSHSVDFAFKSNWLRCINFTNILGQANLKIVHYDNKVFFQAMENINPNEELLLYNNIGAKIPKEPDTGQESNSHEDIDCIVFSDNDVEEVPFVGKKYSKDMILDIAKLWRSKPLMTISETLEVISRKHPQARSISERYMSKLTRKYRLRHKGGSNVKFDSQMYDFVRMLLHKYPWMPVAVVGQKLKSRFPTRFDFDIETLDNIIKYQNLRPSQESRQFISKYPKIRKITDDTSEPQTEDINVSKHSNTNLVDVRENRQGIRADNYEARIRDVKDSRHSKMYFQNVRDNQRESDKFVPKQGITDNDWKIRTKVSNDNWRSNLNVVENRRETDMIQKRGIGDGIYQTPTRDDNVRRHSKLNIANVTGNRRKTGFVKTPVKLEHISDLNLVANINKLMKEDPYIGMEKIILELKEQFPFDKSIDNDRIKRLWKYNQFMPSKNCLRKIDDEMVKTIYELRTTNPHFSAKTINEYLRKLLPQKPFVEPNAIYLILRKFNLTSREIN